MRKRNKDKKLSGEVKDLDLEITHEEKPIPLSERTIPPKARSEYVREKGVFSDGTSTGSPITDDKHLCCGNCSNPVEIIKGFIEFITSQDRPITASSRHDKTVWLKEVERYLDETDV